ncbi:hypothetical protein ACWD1Z_37540, partial [Streptomyces sp. NPDC002784]
MTTTATNPAPPQQLPGPHTPSIAEHLVTPGTSAPVARYGDAVWPLAPLIDNPSTARHSIYWNTFPAGPLR